MDHSFYELDPSAPARARYATFALSEPEVVGPEAGGWLGGAGGIYSTPGDLARWDLALIGGKVLKPESYALLTASRSLCGRKAHRSTAAACRSRFRADGRCSRTTAR